MKKRISIGLLTTVLLLLSFNLVSEAQVLVISTDKGDIQVKLDSDKAPVTVKNFLMYVDSGYFKNGSFYRVVTMQNQPNDSIRIEVIQGGKRRDGSRGFAPIALETTEQTGILHKNGVISMARGSANSATSEFFICVGDQPSLDFGGLRNKDGQGFAAFGKVVKGMDVVLLIQNGDVQGQNLSTPVVIHNISRK